MERPPVLFAVSLLASVAMGFRVGLLPTTAGLDESVIYAFNHASAGHLEWGRDFLSTYGPYGYIIGTMDVGQLAWRGAVFNLVLAVACGPVAALYVQSLESVRHGLRVLSALVVIYATSIQDVEYHWFSLFILMYLIALRTRGWKGLVWHATAGLLAGFYLLMKLSLGIGALLTLLVGAIITGRREALLRMLLAGSAATAACVVGWFAYSGHAQGLATYLVTGWQIASGYSSAMSHAPDR